MLVVEFAAMVWYDFMISPFRGNAMFLASHRGTNLLRVGMVCLILSVGSQSFNLTFGLTPDRLHFLRGMALGISLVTLIGTCWLRWRDGRAG
jgi:hypothetical protein